MNERYMNEKRETDIRIKSLRIKKEIRTKMLYGSEDAYDE